MTQAREPTRIPASLPELTPAKQKQPNNKVRLHPFLTLLRAAADRGVVQLLSRIGRK